MRLFPREKEQVFSFCFVLFCFRQSRTTQGAARLGTEARAPGKQAIPACQALRLSGPPRRSDVLSYKLDSSRRSPTPWPPGLTSLPAKGPVHKVCVIGLCDSHRWPTCLLGLMLLPGRVPCSFSEETPTKGSCFWASAPAAPSVRNPVPTIRLAHSSAS